MTLAELIIATAMLGVISAAVASFSLAVSAGWSNSESRFQAENAAKIGGERLEDILSSMLYVAQAKTSTTASPNSHLFYWQQDGAIGAEDGKAQLGEMALLEFDSEGKTVRLYRPRYEELTPAQQAVLANEAWGDPTAPEIITYFKSLEGVVMRPVIGGENSDLLVERANFKHFAPTGARPMTAYAMRFSKRGAQSGGSGTVPMRVGHKPTNFS